MKREVTIAEFFVRGMKALKMGEYTLHADGQLELRGKKQAAGMIVVDESRRRITVQSLAGVPVVTEAETACVPVFESAEERAARENVENLGRTVVDLQEKLAEATEEASRAREARDAAIAALAQDRAMEAAKEPLRALQARYEWLVDKVIAPDYGDNDKGRKGYVVAHCKGPAWIGGESVDAAIDEAIADDTKPS